MEEDDEYVPNEVLRVSINDYIHKFEKLDQLMKKLAKIEPLNLPFSLQDYPELMDQAYQRALRSEMGYGNDYQDWLQEYYDQLQR